MIRESNLNDLELINSLMSYFNVNAYAEINNPFVKFIVCEVSGNIIGCIDYSSFDNRIEINYIIVKEEYQHKGIATKMLEYMIEESKKIENITLEVSIKNIKAINFYHKNGFIDVSIRKNYYLDGADAIMMMRRF